MKLLSLQLALFFVIGLHSQTLYRVIDGKDAGLVHQRVPEVWEAGYYGQGVLIASIDEDFNWDHPDIVNQIWNNLGEDLNGNGVTIIWNGNRWVYDPVDLNNVDDDGNGYVDDFIGWNFVNNNNIVTRNDATSHGTQVAGVLVGDGTGTNGNGNGTKTGIAPQAKLMLLRIGTNSEQEQYFAWEAMQYAIDMGVDIISQSQSFHWDRTWCDDNGQNCGPPDVAKFREMAELELAAGIIHFSSISNNGDELNITPIPFNISVPGNLPPPWLHPDQTLKGGLTAMVGVGNVNAWNPNVIYYNSPYGPSSQEDYSYAPWSNVRPMPIEYQDYPYNNGDMGLLKPDLSAYGASTESINGTYPNFNYGGFSGTSSATAHAAGVAALLLSVNPNLTPEDICRILKLTSIDNGPTGHDNRYGAGTVDAYEAYLMAIEELPVELSAFTANFKEDKIVLEWKTETEVNNYGFDIERAIENSDWFTIGFVEGHGNSNSPKQYSFNDTDIQQSGTYYYRLKQIDNDGTFEYSDVVTVTVGVPVLFALSQNYPNPFNPETRIDYTLPEQQNVSLRVYNILGEMVQELLNEIKPPGSYSVTFDASNLPSGIYIYRIQTESFAVNKKMTFLK